MLQIRILNVYVKLKPAKIVNSELRYLHIVQCCNGKLIRDLRTSDMSRSVGHHQNIFGAHSRSLTSCNGNMRVSNELTEKCKKKKTLKKMISGSVYVKMSLSRNIWW